MERPRALARLTPGALPPAAVPMWIGRSSGQGSRRRLRAGSAEGPEEFSYVGDEEAGCFHGGEVPAAVELAPVHDVVFPLGNGPDGDVHREDRHAGGNSGGLVRLSPASGAFVVEAGGGPCRLGQPVDADV